MENTTKTLLEKIVQEEQDNTIQSYNYDGIELRQSEPVILRNTLLLTMFRPQSFLILRCERDAELEYDSYRNSLEILFSRGIEHNGSIYKLLGGSSSLKDGRIMLATDDVIQTIHSQFNSCQEVLSYLGIYTSNNVFGIYDLGYTVATLEQAYQAGNVINEDGQGFIPSSLLRELGLPDKQIQVRLIGDKWLCKGTLHPYEGDSILIDPTMIKGNGKIKDGYLEFLLGVREVARKLPFKSNWTLLQFMSEATISSTVQQLSSELDGLENVLTNRDKALSFIGTIDDEDDRFKLESFLKSGLEPSHPYLLSKLRKHLKKRLCDLALGSCINLTGYMACCADIPKGEICCIDKAPGQYVLTRYPIRDYKSFLIVENDHSLVENVKSGSLYICSEDILQVDGDFDGDYVVLIDNKAVLEEVKSPQFGNGYQRLDEGTKSRKEDPLELLPYVGSEVVSVGNKVGYITYLINSCILNEKEEYIPELSKGLQMEVQSLKWSTKADRAIIEKLSNELDVVETYRECKFNPKSFLLFIPEIAPEYEDKPLFIPYKVVQDRFQAMYKTNDLLNYRNKLPIYEHDTTTYYDEVSGVQRLYNGWLSDILEEYKDGDKDPTEALQTPINFLNVWSASKEENRMDWACTIWSATHKRSNGSSIGSFAFHCFTDEILDLLRENRCEKPKYAVSEPILSRMKTLRAVGGYYDCEGVDTSEQLRVFKTKVRSLGRMVSVYVKRNGYDQKGKDFYVDELRIGSLPKDLQMDFSHINIGDNFDCFISQFGKVVYLHVL